MTDADLVAVARRAPESLRFTDAVRLARQLGFEKVRQAGGHRVYRGPLRAVATPLNLQESRDGHAKAFQIERMLRVAEAAGRLPRER